MHGNTQQILMLFVCEKQYGGFALYYIVNIESCSTITF